MNTILVVDDDPHIREVVCFALERAGLTPVTAADGAEALAAHERHAPALVILDIGLPELNGLDVCRQMRRETNTPILFLSARDEEIDRVLGLEIGGDDYVTKPFSPRELVARVTSILRRTQGSAAPAPPESDRLAHGVIVLDRAHRSLTVAGTDATLTALEFDILTAFLTRPRFTFTREALISAAYPVNMHVSDRTIDSHVRNIRGKLGKLGIAQVIETVHGVGFRLGSCELSA